MMDMVTVFFILKKAVMQVSYVLFMPLPVYVLLCLKLCVHKCKV